MARAQEPGLGERYARAPWKGARRKDMIQRADDDDLESDFPLGDGTAETATVVSCSYCGETVEIALDPGGGAVQEYVEDCQVCCRPWRVSVRYDEAGGADVSITPLDE